MIKISIFKVHVIGFMIFFVKCCLKTDISLLGIAPISYVVIYDIFGYSLVYTVLPQGNFGTL